MKFTNRLLINALAKLRNRIHSGDNLIQFKNFHSANNEISISGHQSSIAFDTAEGYLRSSRVIINGNKNTVLLGDGTELVDNSSIRIVGNNNSVTIGNNCNLRCFSIFIIGNNNNITLGNNISAIYASLHMENDDNAIEIGDGTTIHGRNASVVELAVDEGTCIRVGNDCMISNDVEIRSSDSHSVLDNNGNRLNPAEDIIVFDHVWIGMRAMILKGTVIGNNCIVGAGSICNKNYEEENVLIAGNPAKIVKEKVNWSRDRL